ncbi:MAG: 50S ribosomal protein L32 [Vampirovibrio sp.]|nr:50S ribosomal protein L32 [Vampirovibrio sp.]
MPVPKQRVGHSDQGHRRSNWKATVPALTKCQHCGAVKLPHVLCVECGFYKNRIVSEKFHTHDHGDDHDHDHDHG